MQKLCDRCIRALRSRGEMVLIGYALDVGDTDTCSWCERNETELFEVMINPFTVWGDR